MPEVVVTGPSPKEEIDRLRAENAALKEDVEQYKKENHALRSDKYDELRRLYDDIDDLACLYGALYSSYSIAENRYNEDNRAWVIGYNQLSHELLEAQDENESLAHKNNLLISDIKSLRSAIARKDEALRWYGDETNYDPIDPKSLVRFYQIFLDRGQRAREVI